MRKCTSILLIVALLLALAVPVSAAPAEQRENAGIIEVSEGVFIGPQWLEVSTITQNLTISSSGNAAVSVSANTYDRSYKISITVTLQAANGSRWSDKKSWSGSGYGNAVVDKTYNVTTGIYRLKTVCKVYDSSGKLVETVPAVYSGTESY